MKTKNRTAMLVASLVTVFAYSTLSNRQTISNLESQVSSLTTENDFLFSEYNSLSEEVGLMWFINDYSTRVPGSVSGFLESMELELMFRKE